MKARIWSWVATFWVVALVPAASWAQPVLSADVNGVVGLRDTNDHGVNIGVGGRLGYQIGMGVVVLTPEGMFEWDRFDDELHTIRVLGGLRLSGGKVIQPSIFGHVGWGQRSLNDVHDDDVAVDAGAALDFTAVPFLRVGAQAAYNMIIFDDVFDFLTFGAHLSLIF